MQQDKNKKPTDDAMKNYNAKDRDFQRTEEEVDNVSGGEKQDIENKKKSATENSDKKKNSK